MKVKITNTKVQPIYWAHLRPWPYNAAVELDLTEHELAPIRRDERLNVEEVGPVAAQEDDSPFDSPKMGRPKKGK